MELLSQTNAEFEKRFHKKPVWTVSAPGRVNLIGEHTDYNDGFVLPMAIERRTIISAAPIEGNTEDGNVAKVYSVQTGETASILLDGTSKPPVSAGDVRWSSYIQGVAAKCFEAGLKPSAFCAVINSDVPLGGGLSSSASLEVAFATLLEVVTEKKLEPVQKSLLCQAAEHEYAKMPCGIMDQFVSTLAEKDHAMLLDCKTRQPQMVSMNDPDVSVLIVNSNKKHELTGSEYPERRQMCFDAAEILGVSKLRDATLEMLETAHPRLTEKQYQRAKHVISENLRTQAMAVALAEKDWAYCGQLMYKSHFSLSLDYEVSTSELDLLVILSRTIGLEGGIYGARMTGGGFGGCMVSLAKTSKIQKIASEISRNYSEIVKIVPTIFVTRPAQGAEVLCK